MRVPWSFQHIWTRQNIHSCQILMLFRLMVINQKYHQFAPFKSWLNPLAGTNKNIGNDSISFKYVKQWPNLRQFYSCAFFKFPHWNLGICLGWSSPYGLPTHYTGNLLHSNISLPGYFALYTRNHIYPFQATCLATGRYFFKQKIVSTIT